MNAATKFSSPILGLQRQVGFAKVEELRKRQRSMREALFAVVDCLPGQPPAPRAFWYDLNREERSRIMAVDDDVAMCRVALAEARKHGPCVVNKVRAAIRHYFAAKAEAALCEVENGVAITMPDAAATITKELSDVMVAATRVVADPSLSNQHALRLEVAEGREALDLAQRIGFAHELRSA